MKRVLVISFTDLSKDPRVNRQIRFLKDKYNVSAIGLKDPQIDDVNFISCGRFIRTTKEKISNLIKLISKRFEDYYWSANHIKICVEKLSALSFDIIIANDIDSLPLALKISKGAKVILDAHEFSPKEFEDSLKWRVLYQKYKKYLCLNYIPKVNAMMTVCNGISKEYEKICGVKSIVVTNTPKYHEIIPKKTDDNKIKMILHGGANPSRKIENMIEMMDYLDERFYLDLMVIGSDKYINKLKKLASGNSRIKFIPPVPMPEICNFISNYDMGVYLLEPNSFNNRMALPNKFFEFIQARLAIAIGPSPEMARIVIKYQCGVVAEDFTPIAIAKAIKNLDSSAIDYCKSQADKLSRIICAESNKKIIIDLIESL